MYEEGGSGSPSQSHRVWSIIPNKAVNPKLRNWQLELQAF